MNAACRRTHLLLTLAVVALAPAIGCGAALPLSWAERTESKTLPRIGLKEVAVTTDNGEISVRPAREGSDSIEVTAHIRVGALGDGEAAECLRAVEIVAPTSGPADSVQEIRWEWRQPKKPHWQATVSFEVRMPADLALRTDTTNGATHVAGIEGACELKTVNGKIEAVAVAAERLKAESTNGELQIETPATQVDLKTTNGRINAALGGAGELAGNLQSTNGGIRVALAKDVDVELHGKTSNGRVSTKLKLDDRSAKRRELSGRLGKGGGKLDVRTVNGDISFAPSERD